MTNNTASAAWSGKSIHESMVEMRKLCDPLLTITGIKVFCTEGGYKVLREAVTSGKPPVGAPIEWSPMFNLSSAEVILRDDLTTCKWLALEASANGCHAFATDGREVFEYLPKPAEGASGSEERETDMLTEDPTDDFVITALCDGGHRQTVHYCGMSRKFVEGVAGLLDGSSPMYQFPPGDDSVIGKCSKCGAKIHCTVENAPKE